MPVEVGVKVTLSIKKESGESESKTIPLKDFKSPNEPGTPEFWEDVLGFVARYRLRPDTTQKQLVTGSKEAKEAATSANSLGEKLKKEKKQKPVKDTPTDDATPAE